MSSKKTPIATAIDITAIAIAGIKMKYKDVSIISIEDKARLEVLDGTDKMLRAFLPSERSAIEAAYDQGDTDRMNHERGKESKFVSKKQYYINTYDTYQTQKDNG